MRASQVITLQIFDGSIWRDYTDGLIFNNVIRGIEQYSGPLTQPDVGQLTITSRNPELDPYNNPFIKYNARIRLTAFGIRIFSGTIEGINVDYKPKGEPPIVTINAIDMLGTLQKHILSDEFLAANTSTYDVFLNLESEIDNYDLITFDTDGTTYTSGQSPSGTTALDALSIRAKTDRGFFYTNARNEVKYFRRESTSPLHPFNINPVKITFDYEGNGESYQTISLSDGFENIVNAIDVNGTNNTNISSIASDSINLWGKSSATVNLQTDNIASLQTVANQVLVEMGEPVREIYNISWDAMNDPGTAHSIDLFDNIQINHKINETTTINRKYSIIGIKHEIDATNWIITYALRNFDYQTTSIPNPVIVISPTSGDTNTDFTVTWTHPNPELFTTTSWDLGDGFTSTNRTTTVNYNSVGTKHINLVATTVYGYTKEVTVPLEVSIGAPLASFTYTVDANRVYHFTFTGDSATEYLWTFGDGTSSTEANPSKYYMTGGSRTITVKATNSIGFTTSSKTIETLALLKIPVRYVRLRYVNVSNSWLDYENSLFKGSNHTYDIFSEFKIKKLDGTSINDWVILDHEEYYGYMAEGNTILDDYRRHKSIPHNTLASRMQGTQGLLPMKYQSSTLPTDTVVMSTIIDLGQEYFDLNKIEVKRFDTAHGFGANIILDVSKDQGVWYKHGTIDSVNYNSLVSNFTLANGSYTTPHYALTEATAIPSYLPVRYVKIVSNTFANVANKMFQFNEIIGIAAGNQVTPYNGTYSVLYNGTTYTGERPVDWCIGFGTIDESRNTGASFSYPTSYNTGQIYGAGSTGGYSIYPGTLLTGYLNGKNTKSVIKWDESAGQRTILIDLGVAVKKLKGFVFDMRYVDGTLYDAPGSSHKVTISVSENGINWTTFNEAALSLSTQTGCVTISTSDGAPLQTGAVLGTAQLDSGSFIRLTP